MSNDNIIQMIMWWAGLCSAGFLFLAGWMLWLVRQIHARVTYTWIETQFKKDIDDDMVKLTALLKEIRDALLGDLKEEGLISRTRKLEERCVNRHAAEAGKSY